MAKLSKKNKNAVLKNSLVKNIILIFIKFQIPKKNITSPLM